MNVLDFSFYDPVGAGFKSSDPAVVGAGFWQRLLQLCVIGFLYCLTFFIVTAYTRFCAAL